MKKLILFLLIFLSINIFAQNASYKRISVDTLKSLNIDKKIDLKDTINILGKLKIPANAQNGYVLLSNGSGVASWGNSADSIYLSYCSGCLITSAWKLSRDTIFIDTSYVNSSLQILINDTVNIVHFPDTNFTIATHHMVDTLTSSVYSNIADLDTGKVSTMGDTMYGDLIINANVGIGEQSPNAKLEIVTHSAYQAGLSVTSTSGSAGAFQSTTGLGVEVYTDSSTCIYAASTTGKSAELFGDADISGNANITDTVTADKFKQSTYFNSLASWNNSGVLNDTIIPKNVSDTLWNKILAIRVNKHDTSFSDINLIANTTLFPKGTHFEIYRGIYNDTANIARDSCSYYFHPSKIIKTNTGSIFDYSNSAIYSNDIKVFGDVIIDKTIGTGSGLKINSNTNTFNVYFEFDKIECGTDNGIDIYITTMSLIGKIKGNSCTSVSSRGVDIRCATAPTNNDKYIDLEIGTITSTTSDAFTSVNSMIKLRSNYIASGISSPTKYGIYCTGGGIDYDVTYCSGAYFNMGNASNMSSLNTFKGYIKYVNIIGYYGTIGVIDIESCGELHNNNAQVNIGYVKSLTSDGDYSRTTVYGTQIDEWQNNMSFNVSKGIVKYNYFKNNRVYSSYSSLTGGTVIIEDGEFRNHNSSYAILQSGGNLGLNGRLNVIVAGKPTTLYSVVYKTGGGKLILNGATFIRDNAFQTLINAPSSLQYISVYAGGFTSNAETGNLLGAKARKDSMTVTAVAITTVAINDGTGTEVFTETDITTYNTVDLMAARMAALINASPSIDVDATYVSGSTFNIEAEIPGLNYVFSGVLVNLTNVQTRNNSYNITDNTGGTIIESSNVY